MKDSSIGLVKRKDSAPRWALVRLLGLVPLLAVTMAAGPCGKEPLGSVDAGATSDAGDGCNRIPCFPDAAPKLCTYQGTLYPAGSSFSAGDACNSCNCGSDGFVYCSHQTCLDAGSDGIEGGSDLAGRCFDNTGTEIPCSDGGTTDAAPICVDVNGKMVPCTKDGGMDVCSYGGKTFPAGAGFAATDGCNKCTCGADGFVSCTTLGCVDAGADAKTGACSPANDWSCNEDPTIDSLRGTCQPDGSCKCATGAVSPYTGRCVASDNVGGAGCELGKTFPVGATFPCGDPCSTCTCLGPGQIVADTTHCTDAGSPSCGLDTGYAYGDVGGLRAYQDQVTLFRSPVSPWTYATYTYRRTPVDGSKVLSCAPALPPCGDPNAIDLSDIMADILDPVVQKYLLNDPAKTPFLGFDTRPIDGTAFSFTGNKGGFLVGQACGMSSAASSCVPIPPAIDKLVKDLRALDQQQLSSMDCAALR